MKGSRLGVSSTPTLLVGRPALSGPLRLRRHNQTGGFSGSLAALMIHRMTAALLSLTRALHFRIPLSLQDRQDRNSGLRNRGL